MLSGTAQRAPSVRRLPRSEAPPRGLTVEPLGRREELSLHLGAKCIKGCFGAQVLRERAGRGGSDAVGGRRATGISQKMA